MTHPLRKALIFVLILLSSTLFLSGCLSGYGEMKPNPQWQELNSNRQLPQDYKYYFCGRSNIPYAVVGIAPEWTFKGRFWFDTDTMEQVYYLVDSLSDLHPHPGPRVSADILSAGGAKIGVWFSHYPNSVVQVDEEKKTVSVLNPYNPNNEAGLSVIHGH